MNTLASVAPEQWVLSDALNEFARDGEFDLVVEIIDLFLADSEEKILSVTHALSASDFTEARRIAHGLKGAARQMGIASLSGCAECLELSSAAASAADLHRMGVALSECWVQVKEAVLATRNSLRPI